MSSKQLTASVRLNTSQAEKAINNLVNKLSQINKQVNSFNTNNIEKHLNNGANSASRLNREVQKTKATADKLNSPLGKTSIKISEIKTRVQSWLTSQQQVNASIRNSHSLLGSIGSRLRGIAATYLGIMGMRGAINVSDNITSAENKLNYVSAQHLGDSAYASDGSYSNAVFAQTQENMNKMYASAQRVGMSYNDMMSNVSKSMALASKAFGGSTDAAIRFQEIMAEAYAVGGASAAEMSSSMYQMIQALGSGTLAGDELRSVREGAPLAYQAIEKFVQGVYDTEESLKDLASQGKVTSDMVVAAIMNSGNELDKAFALTEQTFARTWNQIKNAAIKAFAPVSKTLRKTLNSALDSGLIDKIEYIFVVVSVVIQKIINLISACFSWIYDNWSWLEGIVVTGLIMLGGYFAWLAVKAIASAIASAVAWTIVHWKLALVLAIIFAIIYSLYLWQQGVIDTTTVILIAAGIIVAALLVIGLVTMNITLLAIAGILLVLMFVFMFFEEVCGVTWGIVEFIVACLATLGNFIAVIIAFILICIVNTIAFVINLIVGCVNVICALFQNGAALIGNIISALGNFIGAVCQNIGIFFSNLWYGATSSFWGFIGDVLSGLADLEPAFNALAELFGLEGVSLSGLTAGAYERANSADSKIKDYVDVGNAWNEGMNTNDYVSVKDAWSNGWNTVDYANLTDALVSASTTFGEGLNGYSWSESYDEGSAWGAGIKDKINEWGSGIKDKLSGDDSILDKLGLGDTIDAQLKDLKDYLGDGIGSSYNMPSPEELLNGANGGGDVGKNLKNIDDNTANIADSMELTQEDVKYLRKIAELEWKKEYTLASVQIDMTNTNTINNKGDLEGWVIDLRDMLQAELEAMANGVYA